MATVRVEREVSKEAYELSHALGKLVVGMKAKAKDGLTIAEVAELFAEELGSIMQAVSGAQNIPSEADENTQAFLEGLVLGLTPIASAFRPPKQ